jgi:hypothetical protein
MKTTYILICLFFISLSLFAQDIKDTQEMPQIDYGNDLNYTVEQMVPSDPESEARRKQIYAYFEEALKNYDEILLQEKNTMGSKVAVKRLDSNIKFLEEREKKGQQSPNDNLQKIKLHYMKKFLILKNSYETEVEKLAKEYQNQLQKVVKAYQGEAKNSENMIKEFKTETDRMNKIFLANPLHEDSFKNEEE